MDAKHISLIFLCLSVLLSAASSQEALFEMDSSGNAGMLLSESVLLDVEEISVLASADESGIISLRADIKDPASLDDVDYDLSFISSADSAELSFEAMDESIREFTDSAGPLDLDLLMEDLDGTLELKISATMQRSFLEEEFFLNVSEIQADPSSFSLAIEDSLNEMFSSFPLQSVPTASVDSFALTGTNDLQFELELAFYDWRQFWAKALAFSYAADDEAMQMADCLGIDVQSIAESILGVGMRSSLSMTASADRISGRLTSTASGDIQSGFELEAMSLEMAKTGSDTEISASLSTDEPKVLLTCVMTDLLPGDYVISNVEYSLIKAASAEDAEQRLQADISSFAKKEGGLYTLTIDSDFTRVFNSTVTVAKEMEIKSVDGGERDDRSAISRPGEEFTVRYGESGPGFDLNMLLIGIIIVVVLLLLVRRKN